MKVSMIPETANENRVAHCARQRETPTRFANRIRGPEREKDREIPQMKKLHNMNCCIGHSVIGATFVLQHVAESDEPHVQLDLPFITDLKKKAVTSNQPSRSWSWWIAHQWHG